MTGVLEKQFTNNFFPLHLAPLKFSVVKYNVVGRAGRKGKSLAQSPIDIKNTSGYLLMFLQSMKEQEFWLVDGEMRLALFKLVLILFISIFIFFSWNYN